MMGKDRVQTTFSFEERLVALRSIAVYGTFDSDGIGRPRTELYRGRGFHTQTLLLNELAAEIPPSLSAKRNKSDNAPSVVDAWVTNTLLSFSPTFDTEQLGGG